jgi:hypothetical protein
LHALLSQCTYYMLALNSKSQICIKLTLIWIWIWFFSFSWLILQNCKIFELDNFVLKLQKTMLAKLHHVFFFLRLSNVLSPNLQSSTIFELDNFVLKLQKQCKQSRTTFFFIYSSATPSLQNSTIYAFFSSFKNNISYIAPCFFLRLSNMLSPSLQHSTIFE